MDYKLLNTEITTDPLGLGYAPFVASGNDQGIADLLNRKDDAYSVIVSVIPVSRVLEWAGTRHGDASSPMKAITAASNNTSSPVQDIAQVAIGGRYRSHFFFFSSFGFCRGLFQYGFLHFGHTRGSGASCTLGTHSCSHLSHFQPQS